MRFLLSIALLRLLAGATSAEAAWYLPCLRFLKSEASIAGMAIAAREGADAEDDAKLRALEHRKPWPAAAPTHYTIGWKGDDVESAFLDALREQSLEPYVGFDVAFRMAAIRIADNEDETVVEIAHKPQRVLTREALPSAERSAFQRLLGRPASKRPFRSGFRESLVVVGYLRDWGALHTPVFDGDAHEIPRAAVDLALRNLEDQARLYRRALVGFTLIHVHPETHVPLTEPDVLLADSLAHAWRRKLPTGATVAIAAGASGDPVVFRYETQVGQQSP